MKRPMPDEEYLEDEAYSDDYVYVDEDENYTTPRSSGAVVFLGAAAALCALVLLVVIGATYLLPVLRSAQSGPEDDPSALLHGLRLEEEEVLKENPILETETEPTTEPTIPPELSPFDQYDFQYDKRNFLTCLKQESYVGVDVSAFQHDIDWNQVKAAGVDFAMLRLGYRGWGAKGTLVKDEYIDQNLAGTAAAGIPIGVYFFSQAATLDEVYEEIEFMLEILGDYPLEYPIVLDWEIPDPDARTKNMDARTLTDIQLHFCGQMKKMGFQPMIYFNWHQSENLYYLSELEEYPFWLALYQDRMTYPWKVEMWQWTSSGRVPGIQGNVDINVYMPY